MKTTQPLANTGGLALAQCRSRSPSGGASSVVEGGTSAAVEGGASSVVGGGASSVVEGGASSVVEGGASSVVEGGVYSVVEGGASSVVEGGASVAIASAGTASAANAPVARAASSSTASRGSQLWLPPRGFGYNPRPSFRCRCRSGAVVLLPSPQTQTTRASTRLERNPPPQYEERKECTIRIMDHRSEPLERAARPSLFERSLDVSVLALRGRSLPGACRRGTGYPLSERGRRTPESPPQRAFPARRL